MKTTTKETTQCIDNLLIHHHALLNDGIIALPIKEVIGELESVKKTILLYHYTKELEKNKNRNQR